ncbi:MAG: tyrosine--tRNA ligase, partial [Oscillochloris sp.]|nr:tyrosine--tRNA ligase [Oscillochloris sp.]
MLQGYDSVAIKADVEFGGTDQKFNNLAGRELMSQLGMRPQHVLLVPLILGTDGRKMGKTFNNTVDITLPPFEMLGKIMSMSDEVLPLYFEVLTDVPLGELAEIRSALAAGAVNPRDLKMRLAREVVSQFHSPADAVAAEEAFVRQFVQRELPEEIPVYVLQEPTSIVQVLTAAGLAPSNGEARRLIAGGGVRAGGEKVEGFDLMISPGADIVIQVGRRKFVRVV